MYIISSINLVNLKDSLTSQEGRFTFFFGQSEHFGRVTYLWDKKELKLVNVSSGNYSKGKWD